MRIFVSSLFIFSMVSGFIFAQGSISDRATGVSFPGSVTVDYNGQDNTLEATGVSTRKKFFAKVYSIASYMEKPTSNVGEMDDQIKQLTLIWVRNVSAKKVQDGYVDSLRDAAGNQYGNLKSDIDRYVGFFSQGVRDRDEHVIRSFPGGKVEVYINGDLKGTIENPEFAKALWNVWFGSRSVVKRNDLLKSVR